MNRRRSRLEMLVCALLVAALAVSPAVGDDKRRTTSAASAAAQAMTATPAQAPGVERTKARAGRSAAKARAAQAPAPPPAASVDPAPPPPSAQPGPAVDPGTMADAVPAPAAPEQGDPGTPPGVPAQTAPPRSAQPGPAIDPGTMADAAPAPAAPEQSDPGTPPEVPAQTAPPPAEQAAVGAAPPAAEADTASRDPDASLAARIGPANGGSTSAAPPTAETPASGDLAIAPPAALADQADTQEPGSDTVAVPDEGTGARPPDSGDARDNSLSPRRSAQASPGGGTAPRAQPRSTVAPSAIGSSLVTPATEALRKVRDAGASATSRPRPRPGDSVPTFQGAARSGASESVGEVLVSWAKYALAVLVLLVLALGVNGILAAARTRRLERQRERLMEDIGLLQAALLPAVPSRIGALLTTVAYRPADGPAAGGDFYDAFALPDGRVGLLLGDVSGHGRQALAKTTLVRFTVRAHLEAGLCPREALAIAGRSLDGRLSNDFATVIAAIHDPAKDTLTYASAGHPPPIVVGASHHQPVTVSSAPPIGAGFPTGQRQTVLPMPEGTSVMIYSDGLLEARVDGVALGPERLAAWLRELGPDATAKAVLDRVVAHADRVPDDLAAVLVHASPGATAPAARIEQLKLDVLDMDGPDLEGFLRAAGVSDLDRRIAGHRVSELLATTSGVIVDVRTGEHPMVSVAPIGDDARVPTRPSARTR
jgi:serine phosphatase RsbU (regulator of sigma subunit)